ncbi:MAG: hypothetical protein ACERKD_17005 [Prolixibacteraceae bacterium]
MKISTRILNYINEKNKEEFDPYYIYEKQLIQQQCRAFQSISFENKAIHFASMANIQSQFLEIIKAEKINIFVNSILHLQAAKAVGFKKQEIIFTASALSKKIMVEIEKSGIQLNLDSPNQLRQWLNLFPDQPVGIRCNIGDEVKPFSTHAGFFIGSKSRLGFTREEMDTIPDKTKIKGLHLYVGTDIFDINYFISCYKQLIKMAADFPSIEYLNFGGGFGVSENGEKQFNFSEFNIQVSNLMHETSRKLGRNIKLILEPGRIIGGEAGYFVCHVTDLKKRSERTLVGVNASTVQFSRPLLYPEIAKHPIAIIRNGVQLISDQSVTSIIYGCSTYSRDIFADEVELPELQIGDILVFGNAGSYCASSHMQFLGFPKPQEFFV